VPSGSTIAELRTGLAEDEGVAGDVERRAGGEDVEVDLGVAARAGVLPSELSTSTSVRRVSEAGVDGVGGADDGGR